MKRALSRAFDPPAPVVPIQLRAPGGVDSTTLEGKLDTGADLCAVPEHYVATLNLPPVRTVRASGFLGAPQETIVYRVDITIDGVDFSRVEALATRRPYAIIGRNVMRRLVLRVDGPKERLEIGLPRSLARRTARAKSG
jgi:predicted aspartyl protease